MLTQLVVCLAVLGADDTAPANNQAAAPKFAVGSRVIVIHETPLRVDDRAVKQLQPGEALTVEETQDGFLGVTAGRQGWVDEKDVVIREKAIESLSDLITHDPDNVDLRQARGQLAAEQKKWNVAIDDYTQLVRLEPNEAKHYLDRGAVLEERHDWDKAMKDFDDAVRLSNNSNDALMARGTAWGDKGDADKAIADFDEALKSEADDSVKSEILRRRGNVYANRRDFEKALADFKEAIQLNFADPWIFYSARKPTLLPEN